MKRRLQSSNKTGTIAAKRARLTSGTLSSSLKTGSKNAHQPEIDIYSLTPAKLFQATSIQDKENIELERDFLQFCKYAGVNIGSVTAGDTSIGRGMVASMDILQNEIMTSLPGSLALTEVIAKRSAVGRVIEAILYNIRVGVNLSGSLPNMKNKTTNKSRKQSQKSQKSKKDSSSADTNPMVFLPGQLSLYAFLIYHRFSTLPTTTTVTTMGKDEQEEKHDYQQAQHEKYGINDTTLIEGNPRLLPYEDLSTVITDLTSIVSTPSKFLKNEEDGLNEVQIKKPITFWTKYCQWLPATYGDPLWWGYNNKNTTSNTQTEHALQVLEGTNLLQAIPHRLEGLKKMYLAVFVPAMNLAPHLFNPEVFTFERFLWAHSAYTSRGFPARLIIPPQLLDALTDGDDYQKGVKKLHRVECDEKTGHPAIGAKSQAYPMLGAMLPFLDLTNHRHDHPIGWITKEEQVHELHMREYNVFPFEVVQTDLHATTSVSSQGLEYTVDNVPASALPTQRGTSNTLLAESEALVPTQSIITSNGSLSNVSINYVTANTYTSGEQVFNNYGPKSNEELLLGYGFVLEDNSSDHVAVQMSISSYSNESLRILESCELNPTGAYYLRLDGISPLLLHSLRIASLTEAEILSPQVVAKAITIGQDLVSQMKVATSSSSAVNDSTSTKSTESTGPNLLDESNTQTLDRFAPLGIHVELRILSNLREMIKNRLATITSFIPKHLSCEDDNLKQRAITASIASYTANETVPFSLEQTPQEILTNYTMNDNSAIDSKYSSLHWFYNETTKLLSDQAAAKKAIQNGEFETYCALIYRHGQRRVLLHSMEEIHRLEISIGSFVIPKYVVTESETETEAETESKTKIEPKKHIISAFNLWKDWINKNNGYCALNISYQDILETNTNTSMPVIQYGVESSHDSKINTQGKPGSSVLSIPKSLWISYQTLENDDDFSHVYEEIIKISSCQDPLVLFTIYLLFEKIAIQTRQKKSIYAEFINALAVIQNSLFSKSSNGQDIVDASSLTSSVAQYQSLYHIPNCSISTSTSTSNATALPATRSIRRLENNQAYIQDVYTQIYDILHGLDLTIFTEDNFSFEVFETMYFLVEKSIIHVKVEAETETEIGVVDQNTQKEGQKDAKKSPSNLPKPFIIPIPFQLPTSYTDSDQYMPITTSATPATSATPIASTSPENNSQISQYYNARAGINVNNDVYTVVHLCEFPAVAKTSIFVPISTVLESNLSTSIGSGRSLTNQLKEYQKIEYWSQKYRTMTRPDSVDQAKITEEVDMQDNNNGDDEDEDDDDSEDDIYWITRTLADDDNDVLENPILSSLDDTVIRFNATPSISSQLSTITVSLASIVEAIYECIPRDSKQFENLPQPIQYVVLGYTKRTLLSTISRFVSLDSFGLLPSIPTPVQAFVIDMTTRGAAQIKDIPYIPSNVLVLFWYILRASMYLQSRDEEKNIIYKTKDVVFAITNSTIAITHIDILLTETYAWLDIFKLTMEFQKKIHNHKKQLLSNSLMETQYLSIVEGNAIKYHELICQICQKWVDLCE